MSETLTRSYPDTLQTAYPLLVIVPEDLMGPGQSNLACNNGLVALSQLLESALSVHGYTARIAWGGLGHELVLTLTRRIDA